MGVLGERGWLVRARVTRLGTHSIAVVGPTRVLTHANLALTQSCSRVLAHALTAMLTTIAPALSLVLLPIISSLSALNPPQGNLQFSYSYIYIPLIIDYI